MTDPNKIARRDNKILTKEKSYHRARLGCITFAVITVLVFTLVLLTNPEDETFLVASSVQFWLWLALAWNCHARLQHIQTIKLGRYCPTCEYDLRGNPDATHCPECGNLAKPDPALPIT